MAPALRQSGFTLLELLVVAAIISVLSLLAIPQYASYKGRAVDAAMQSTLREARLAFETYYVKQSSTYDGADLAALEAHGYSPSPVVRLDVESVDPDSFVIRACAEGGTSPSFVYDSTIGASFGDPGTCNGDGGAVRV